LTILLESPESVLHGPSWYLTVINDWERHVRQDHGAEWWLIDQQGVHG
jgi:hypothetical protein